MSQNSMGKASQQAHFAAIPGQKIPRSKFPIEARRLHTFNAGDVVPMIYIPMLPGDDIRCRIGTLVRLLSPLQRPMMDNLYLDWFVAFGATRLLWENWVKMQGERENPDSSVDYVIPYFFGDENPTYTIGFGGIADGLSFPKGVFTTANVHVSCLLHRMYKLFWNQWMRDQVYQDSVVVSIGDGPDIFDTSTDALLKRGKRHDYFTSALDAPQMGAGVPIPWESDGAAPVYGTEDMTLWAPDLASSGNVQTDSGGALQFMGTTTGANLRFPAQGFSSGVFADVGSISASLNALRTSIVLQQIKELDKRGGTRYIESLRTRWNVITKDERLQRIEYVGGGSSVVGSNNVVQTSESTDASKQGNLTSYMKGGFADSFQYRAPEHGYLMIMVNVRARLTYQQQLSKHLTRATRFDFPEPLTMHLGEEPVFQYEMFYPPAGADTNYMAQVWGWQERWAVDRYTPSTVTGLFASDHPQSLDNWHLALDYGVTPPVHDGDWIKDNPPMDRVVAVPSQDIFQIDLALEGYKISSMPVYSVPGLTRF